MALALAATYPDLVEGVVLMSSGARIHGDATPDQMQAVKQWNAVFADRWGTEQTLALEVFARRGCRRMLRPAQSAQHYGDV